MISQIVCLIYLKTKNYENVLIGKTVNLCFKNFHQHKGTKYNFLDYQLHFNKGDQFSKLNEEGLQIIKDLGIYFS